MSETINLRWEEGVISKIEAFLLKRFPFSKMWARALATTLISAATHNLTLHDKMGPVKANVFFLYISSSGLGFKTPPIVMARKILRDYDRNKLSPSKFTPEGYTEYVEGTPEKKDTTEKVVRKAIPPHPINVILRDEASVILGEIESSPHLATQKEYLSNLWDGYIEGYYTRKMQIEGDIYVYVSLCAASSEYFYDLLEEKFFTQGLGNRVLWVVEDTLRDMELDPGDFFFEAEKDEEFAQLKTEVIQMLKRIEDMKIVFLQPSAAKLWTDLFKKYSARAKKSKGSEGSYAIKIPLNVLKLAMNYAASRISVLPDAPAELWILHEDMERAIEDAAIYEDMWRRVLKEWKDHVAKKKGEHHIPTSNYDLAKFVELAISVDGLITVAEISGALTCPDKRRIGDILDTGMDKGWFTKIASVNDDSQLTPEQLRRFKPPRGFMPNVYKVTEKGKAEYLG